MYNYLFPRYIFYLVFSSCFVAFGSNLQGKVHFELFDVICSDFDQDLRCREHGRIGNQLKLLEIFENCSFIN